LKENLERLKGIGGMGIFINNIKLEGKEEL